MAPEKREGEGKARSIASLRARIDGLTPERQKRFLKMLRKTGCVRDAARAAGVSTTTIDRARRKFADFDARCRTARDLALPNLEAIAYERATSGAPARIIRKGRLFEVRVKPSDAMLRLLLAGAAPHKYGRYAGPKGGSGADGRGGAPGKWSFEAAIAELERALDLFRMRRARERVQDEAAAAEAAPGPEIL